jgi:hypothetical protein
MLGEILDEVEEDDARGAKVVRGIWNAGRDITSALVGGVIGALLALWITNKQIEYLNLTYVMAGAFGIVLFFMYFVAKKRFIL